MYPKGVSDFILDQPRLRDRFAANCLPPTGDINSRPIASHYPDDLEFEGWLAREGWRQDPVIAGYLFYLRTLLDVFENIRFYFEKVNARSRGPKDASTIQTSVDGLMFVASYLYYLDSYHVKGAVLECGCYKGFSSCCLSWACSLLGRRLVVADSFQGLPPNTTQPFYQEHDFTGTLEEVDRNLARFGQRDCVDLIEGFFEQSLRGFRTPLALLWLDVDLQASARDALEHTFPGLDRRGVIFSDEFGAAHISHDYRIVATAGVPGAVASFLDAGGHRYSARHLTDWIAIVVPRAPVESKPVLSPRKHAALMRLLRSQR